MKKGDISDWIIIRNLLRWVKAANHAISGIQYASRTEVHLKFHLAAAFFVLLFCFALGVKKNEFIAVVLITLLVIVSEMFNSAIEAVVDLVSHGEKSPLARIAKDVSAGAVLITSAGALIVGYLILYPYFGRILAEGFWIAKHEPENIALLAVVIVTLVVIFIKNFSPEGSPLRGGFPSGHAAISFSVFTSATYLSSNLTLLITLLSLAVLVSVHRINRRIHKLLEVLVGALLGTTLTVLLFWVFY